MLSSLPVGRINDILRRMEDNVAQPDAVKTCFGILAIMSREENNKSLIAKEGMDAILNAMTSNIDKLDVQEAGCDLLWSLAFNNFNIKEIIAKSGGSSVIVRALKRHNRSSDYLKSACGALSNMCQCKLNQDGVASQGGLQPLVGSIHTHHSNPKLLPFVFDAIASLIVGHEENARSVSALGFIPLVISSLSRHKMVMDVVKSGCHALAILSDVKGHASKIAFAGGVPVVLALLDAHPAYADLHRVAAVVLLRMLQESSHVSREITCHEGVRILLRSLEKGGAQHDTVAAVTHILFTITNPSSPVLSSIESQLWLLSNRPGNESPPSNDLSPNRFRVNGKAADIRSSATFSSVDGLVPISQKLSTTKSGDSSLGSPSGANAKTALLGLVQVLTLYPERRDVVRATCRLLNNLCSFSGVINALDRLNITDKLLDCVNIHRETRDIIDSTTSIIKAINRRSISSLGTNHNGSLCGLVHIYKLKQHDEEAALSCADLLTKHLDAIHMHEEYKTMEVVVLANGNPWYLEALVITIEAINRCVAGLDGGDELVGSSAPVQWTKHTSRLLHCLLAFIEMLIKHAKLTTEDSIQKDVVNAVVALIKCLTNVNGDIITRCQGIIASLSPMLFASETGLLNAAGQERADLMEGSVKEISGDEDATPNERNDTLTIKKPIDISDTHAKHSGISNLHLSKSGHISTARQNSGFWPIAPGGVGLSMGSQQFSDPVTDGFATGAFFGDGTDLKDKHGVKLLENWPNYLERMLAPLNNGSMVGMGTMAPGSSRAFSFDGQTGFLIPNRMHLIYECKYPAGKDITSKVATPVPYDVPDGGLGEVFDHSLTFDSEFESGNLLRAVQRGDATYDLFLRADIHTAGHTQWFYFSVSNTHPPALVKLAQQGVQVPPVRVRFNIVNLTKPDSLFNLGMRPVIYSYTEAVARGVGWIRAGGDISYYVNSFERLNQAGEGINSYFTLSFTIEFTIPKDVVRIAYSYPYTMTDHRHHIQQFMNRPRISSICRQFKLCNTLAGDDCDILIITNFMDKDKDRIGPLNGMDESTAAVGTTSGAKKGKTRNYKPALFFSGRVHPGEPPASWMMKGILDFLLSDSPAAQVLRQSYVIFIVPVLNPDGVVYGNNRCSLAGVDLNRQWKIPMKSSHPTIYHLKALMIAQKRIRDVYMYVDLHGHSRKYNVFMYGCDDKKRPKPQVRAFPRVFSMHAVGRKYVSFDDCSFHIKKGRESTARVVVAKELNVPLSFTLEATFCGSNYGPLKYCHMNIGHLQEVGAAMCDAILSFSISDGQTKDVVLVPSGVIRMRSSEEDSNSDDLDEDFAMLHSNKPSSATGTIIVAELVEQNTVAEVIATEDDLMTVEGGDGKSSIMILPDVTGDLNAAGLRNAPIEVEDDSDSEGDGDNSHMGDEALEEETTDLPKSSSFPDLASISLQSSQTSSGGLLRPSGGIAYAALQGSNSNLMPMPPSVVTGVNRGVSSPISVRMLTPSNIGGNTDLESDASIAVVQPPDSGRLSTSAASTEENTTQSTPKQSVRKKKTHSGKVKSSGKANDVHTADDTANQSQKAPSALPSAGHPRASSAKDSDSEEAFESTAEVTNKPRRQGGHDLATRSSKKDKEKEKSMFPKVTHAQRN